MGLARPVSEDATAAVGLLDFSFAVRTQRLVGGLSRVPRRALPYEQTWKRVVPRRTRGEEGPDRFVSPITLSPPPLLISRRAHGFAPPSCDGFAFVEDEEVITVLVPPSDTATISERTGRRCHCCANLMSQLAASQIGGCNSANPVTRGRAVLLRPTHAA
jgi:hypothetical protein